MRLHCSDWRRVHRSSDPSKPPIPSPGKPQTLTATQPMTLTASLKKQSYPFASAIDTELPKPPERVHIMLDFAATWVEVPDGASDRHYERYPDESLAQWHARLGLTDEKGE